jgi:hypothetical protein
MLSGRANATSVVPVCSEVGSAVVVGAEMATRTGIRKSRGLNPLEAATAVITARPRLRIDQMSLHGSVAGRRTGTTHWGLRTSYWGLRTSYKETVVL